MSKKKVKKFRWLREESPAGFTVYHIIRSVAGKEYGWSICVDTSDRVNKRSKVARKLREARYQLRNVCKVIQ